VSRLAVDMGLDGIVTVVSNFDAGGLFGGGRPENAKT